MKKISPELRVFLSEKGYPRKSSRTAAGPEGTGLESAPAEEITFFLQYRDSLEPLKALGLEVISESGNVIVGKISVDRLEHFAEHPNVILIEKAQPPSIGLDKAFRTSVPTWYGAEAATPGAEKRAKTSLSA